MSKILIVDDEEELRELLETFLCSHGYETVSVANGADALHTTKIELPHLVLLDVMLPDMDGLTVCRRLRQSIRTTYIPIIMLTARQSVVEKVEALSSGADDYVTKPFDLKELLARIQTQLRHVELGLLAELTGLPGNTLIERAISQVVRNHNDRWAILYVDIDQFKAYNDVYGFLRGNDMIKGVARMLDDVIRGSANDLTFLGHIGGDDFVAIVRAEQAEEVAQRIVERFDEQVKEYYSPADMARGYILATNRQGKTAKMPLASLSIGVVTNKYKPVDSVAMVGQLAAEVKAKAKSLPGSAYYIDQRR
jgi:diguanylate cyclase (GGDEF)-like protein